MSGIRFTLICVNCGRTFSTNKLWCDCPACCRPWNILAAEEPDVTVDIESDEYLECGLQIEEVTS
jgi:hypothetical protein